MAWGQSLNLVKFDYRSSVVAQQKQIWLASMKTQVRSLASLSGLRSRRCHELWCRSQMRLRSGIVVAVMWAGGYSSDLTHSLGTSICHGCGPKKKKKKKKEKKGRNLTIEWGQCLDGRQEWGVGGGGEMPRVLHWEGFNIQTQAEGTFEVPSEDL